MCSEVEQDRKAIYKDEQDSRELGGKIEVPAVQADRL